MNETITVYVTKYALTSGIIKCNGKICHEVFSPDNPRKFNMLMLDGFTSKEYVLTETEAQKVFEEKRLGSSVFVMQWTGVIRDGTLI